jgi:hypothetical protein
MFVKSFRVVACDNTIPGFGDLIADSYIHNSSNTPFRTLRQISNTIVRHRTWISLGDGDSVVVQSALYEKPSGQQALLPVL